LLLKLFGILLLLLVLNLVVRWIRVCLRIRYYKGQGVVFSGGVLHCFTSDMALFLDFYLKCGTAFRTHLAQKHVLQLKEDEPLPPITGICLLNTLEISFNTPAIVQ